MQNILKLKAMVSAPKAQPPCGCVYLPCIAVMCSSHRMVCTACRWLSDRIRVLIYSGDVDSCVPTHGTETFFLRTLNMTEEQAWRPWLCDNEHGFYARAGYHKKFGGTKHGIDFMTVNGAGHMVPQYKPMQALTMMSRWLDNSSLRIGDLSSGHKDGTTNAERLRSVRA